MNISRFLAVVMGWVFASTSVWAASHPVDEALPMVGTAEHGHAYPGAIVPFGMMQLSPDTPIQGWDAASGYHYSDTAIRGALRLHDCAVGAVESHFSITIIKVSDSYFTTISISWEPVRSALKNG